MFDACWGYVGFVLKVGNLVRGDLALVNQIKFNAVPLSLNC